MHWIFALAGFALVTWSCAILWCGWASQRWPVVEGELVARDIRYGRNRSGPYFVPAVHYKYAVGHRHFTGRRRRFHVLPQAFVTEQAAYDTLAGFASGSPLPVYYHPRVPRLAVLQPGITAEAPLLMALCVIVLLAAVSEIAKIKF
jgi:hypothetical protein